MKEKVVRHKSHDRGLCYWNGFEDGIREVLDLIERSIGMYKSLVSVVKPGGFDYLRFTQRISALQEVVQIVTSVFGEVK